MGKAPARDGSPRGNANGDPSLPNPLLAQPEEDQVRGLDTVVPPSNMPGCSSTRYPAPAPRTPNPVRRNPGEHVAFPLRRPALTPGPLSAGQFRFRPSAAGSGRRSGGSRWPNAGADGRRDRVPGRVLGDRATPEAPRYGRKSNCPGERGPGVRAVAGPVKAKDSPGFRITGRATSGDGHRRPATPLLTRRGAHGATHGPWAAPSWHDRAQPGTAAIVPIVSLARQHRTPAGQGEQNNRASGKPGDRR